MKPAVLFLLIFISGLYPGSTPDLTIIDHAFCVDVIFEGVCIGNTRRTIGPKNYKYEGAVFSINRIFKGKELVGDSIFITNGTYTFKDSLGRESIFRFSYRTEFKGNRQYLIFIKKVKVHGDSAWRFFKDYKVNQKYHPFDYDHAARLLEKAVPLIERYPPALVDSITSDTQSLDEMVKTEPFKRVYQEVYQFLSVKEKLIVKERYFNLR
jgi:hypothetical protein